MIGPADDADAYPGPELVEIDSRRDRRNLFRRDSGLDQLLRVSRRHADAMLDFPCRVEIALAGIGIVFAVREESDLERTHPARTGGIIDVILQVGRRIGIRAVGDVLRPRGNLARALFHDPAAVRDLDMNPLSHPVGLLQSP